MNITTNDDWVTVDDSFDSETQVATTSDPRVLAIIQREPDYPREFLMDGDLINPTYYEEMSHYRDSVTRQGGYQDDEVAEAYRQATSRFRDDEVRARFMKIFYDTEMAFASEPGDRSGQWVIFSTPEFRKACGNDRPDHDAKEDVRTWANVVQNWLDGDVWSVGYATLEGRVLDGGDINYSEWDEVIGCGGFVGEDYAKKEAASFGYEQPELPELMDLEV